ncbi:MAG: hypothetical protein KF886_11325 [Candidatus Hydrogenedentes bacterium]|nr:hypothetical protein [Candidatus Hydrogenedentota bacterium]
MSKILFGASRWALLQLQAACGYINRNKNHEGNIMNTPLNDDTQQKARELARQITVAHDLDPEIQEELYGHIEDKLLAYKSGEERVSDEDAFILVREHFGNTATLKGLFQDVHRGMVERSMLRRLLVAAITTLIYVQGVAWLAHVMDLLFGSANANRLPWGYTSMAVAALACLLPCVCFVRWKRRMRRGEPVWFFRWSTPALAAMALGLFAAGLVLPGFWAPLRKVFEIPYTLHLVLLHSFPPHTRMDYAIYPVAFIAINALLLAILVWGCMRIGSARPEHGTEGGTSRWMRVTWLWLALALLVFADFVVLGRIAANDTNGSTMVVKTLFLACALGSVVPLAFCASWVWWCDTPPRLTRNTAKVALVWGGFVGLYNALPTLKAGLALGKDAWALGAGTTWFKLNVPGTDMWLYLGRSPHDLLYEVSLLPTLTAFAVFFAVTVTLTYRILDRKREVAVAGE